jgi:isoleucyl-tRNA synthetase
MNSQQKTIIQNEEETLQHWKDNNCFHESIRRGEEAGHEPYTFYDGPPFATGLPHHGHLLASSIKDVVPRYHTQNGRVVNRRWGTDCHGLPIEYEIEKELGIKTKDEILALGIDKYNKHCRGIVMRCRESWEKTINRLGRWVDFEHDYKTLDLNFMESVWNVFSTLHEKGLVYKGYRIMPYSTACTTPLSNFEVNSNYQDVSDSSLTVKFEVNKNWIKRVGFEPRLEGQRLFCLVWTTTPWTLPANMMLCVNKNLKYVILKDNTTLENYIMCTDLVSSYYPDEETQIEYLSEPFSGSVLFGMEYHPLFSYLQSDEFGLDTSKTFRVTMDDYVSKDNGTGIVHIAPSHGEDDYRVCLERGIIEKDYELPILMTDNGYFKDVVVDFAGQHVKAKDTDKNVMRHLKERGLVFKYDKKVHSYPFCWRSDTPLIHRPVHCWFIKTTAIKDRIIANNKKINWTPDWVGSNRFGNWLEGMQDWCVSRNRYWGTPLPIWENSTGERVFIGSVEELETRAGLPAGTVTDLHRHNVDHITFPSSVEGGEPLKRTTEVFDCWFESGSVPYAQCHYPFDVDKETFLKKHFPADFIAEGIDQTRGWFHTLLILSTALFDEPCFKNVIVNGLILTKDQKTGKIEKMSKRKKNYTSPDVLLDTYGADALRLYFISNPVVVAKNMAFEDKGLKEIVRDVHIPLSNCFKLYDDLVKLHNDIVVVDGAPFVLSLIDKVTNYEMPVNTLENWLLELTNNFVQGIHTEMSKYNLFHVVRHIKEYIDKLTRWYINLRKVEIKRLINEHDPYAHVLLNVLGNCLYQYCVSSAPFIPYMAESHFRQLKKHFADGMEEKVPEYSVHYTQMIREVDYNRDGAVLEEMELATQLIVLGRKLRTKQNLEFKRPLSEMLVVTNPEKAEMIEKSTLVKSILQSELNVMNVKVSGNEAEYLTYQLTPNFKQLGKKLGKQMRVFGAQLKLITSDEVKMLVNTDVETGGTVKFEEIDYTVNGGDLVVNRQLNADKPEVKSMINEFDNGLLIFVDDSLTPEIRKTYMAKLVCREIQIMRKEFILEATDKIDVYYSITRDSADDETRELLNKMLTTEQERYVVPYLYYQLKFDQSELDHKISNGKLIGSKTVTITIAVDGSETAETSFEMSIALCNQ